MTNQEIAEVFRRLANLLEMRGENPFKIRSYRNAADTIEDTSKPLSEIVSNDGLRGLQALPGIGDAISRKIQDLLSTGTFKLYEEVRAEVPETVLDLLKVDGVGIKTLEILYNQFQLTSLTDFAAFVKGGGLNSVPHLNDRSQSRIKSSLRALGY